MNQTNEIYDLVLNKIKTNGLTLLKDNHPGTNNVSQRAKINNTQLVLSYAYYRYDDVKYSRIERISVGYINITTGKYKPVSNFYKNQQEGLMNAILDILPPAPIKTTELDLIRKLANNQYVQKQK